MDQKKQIHELQAELQSANDHIQFLTQLNKEYERKLGYQQDKLNDVQEKLLKSQTQN